MLRPAQAMLETVIAVAIIASIMLAAFELSRLLSEKIIKEHAMTRVARARAVGMNDFMCEKIAQVALIPISGKRLWPETSADETGVDEVARVPIYLATDNPKLARGILEYENWPKLTREILKENPTDRVESHFELYMMNQGLN